LYQRLQSRDILESCGVGLSIAKKIVEAKGGQINVKSALNKGAKFQFTLPLCEGNEYAKE
jgi:signal transduction histidine kinase